MTKYRFPWKIGGGYGYLKGRDGNAYAVPTGHYVNNFDSALAASIREANQSIQNWPEEYYGKILSVYSTSNHPDDIHQTTKKPPENSIIHIQFEGG